MPNAPVIKATASTDDAQVLTKWHSEVLKRALQASRNRRRREIKTGQYDCSTMLCCASTLRH